MDDGSDATRSCHPWSSHFRTASDRLISWSRREVALYPTHANGLLSLANIFLLIQMDTFFYAEFSCVFFLFFCISSVRRYLFWISPWRSPPRAVAPGLGRTCPPRVGRRGFSFPPFWDSWAPKKKRKSIDVHPVYMKCCSRIVQSV